MSDLIAKMLQEIDAERPAYPETHYDIGYNNGLTMALAIVRKFAKDNNVLTNADRIRAMTDRELAEFITDRSVNEYTVRLLNKDHGLTYIQMQELKYNIFHDLMRWLQQTAEGD